MSRKVPVWVEQIQPQSGAFSKGPEQVSLVAPKGNVLVELPCIHSALVCGEARGPAPCTGPARGRSHLLGNSRCLQACLRNIIRVVRIRCWARVPRRSQGKSFICLSGVCREQVEPPCRSKVGGEQLGSHGIRTVEVLDAVGIVQSLNGLRDLDSGAARIEIGLYETGRQWKYWVMNARQRRCACLSLPLTQAGRSISRRRLCGRFRSRSGSRRAAGSHGDLLDCSMVLVRVGTAPAGDGTRSTYRLTFIALFVSLPAG